MGVISGCCMSWRDGTRIRTAKSIAQFTISDTFAAPLKSTDPPKAKTIVDDLMLADPPSPDSPLKHLASIVLLENEKEKELKATPSKKRVNTKEPSIPKKRKRIRPPSPPRISWNSKSSRRTNTSAAVDYFTDQKYEEKNISTSKTKSKTSSIDKKVEKKRK